MPAIVELNIDPEFQSWIPALRKEERGQLEENIKANGCLEPLIVWSEEFTLLDGHNRYEICHKNKIPFEFREISLPDRDAALQWMLKHQLGRRNLTPEQMSTLRGALYNSIKKTVPNQEGANQHKEVDRQNDGQPKASTAKSLAQQFNVSPRTIERDGQFAKAVETLRSADPEAAELAMSGAVNKADVLAVAKAPERAKESAQVIKQKAKRKKNPPLNPIPKQKVVRLSDTRDAVGDCVEGLRNLLASAQELGYDKIIPRIEEEIKRLELAHGDLCKRCA